MPTEESGASKQDSEDSATGIDSIVNQPATSLSTRPSQATLPSPSANANVSERAGLAQSQYVLSDMTSC